MYYVLLDCELKHILRYIQLINDHIFILSRILSSWNIFLALTVQSLLIFTLQRITHALVKSGGS